MFNMVYELKNLKNGVVMGMTGRPCFASVPSLIVSQLNESEGNFPLSLTINLEKSSCSEWKKEHTIKTFNNGNEAFNAAIRGVPDLSHYAEIINKWINFPVDYSQKLYNYKINIGDTWHKILFDLTLVRLPLVNSSAVAKFLYWCANSPVGLDHFQMLILASENRFVIGSDRAGAFTYDHGGHGLINPTYNGDGLSYAEYLEIEKEKKFPKLNIGVEYRWCNSMINSLCQARRDKLTIPEEPPALFFQSQKARDELKTILKRKEKVEEEIVGS